MKAIARLLSLVVAAFALQAQAAGAPHPIYHLGNPAVIGARVHGTAYVHVSGRLADLDEVKQRLEAKGTHQHMGTIRGKTNGMMVLQELRTETAAMVPANVGAMRERGTNLIRITGDDADQVAAKLIAKGTHAPQWSFTDDQGKPVVVVAEVRNP